MSNLAFINEDNAREKLKDLSAEEVLRQIAREGAGKSTRNWPSGMWYADWVIFVTTKWLKYQEEEDRPRRSILDLKK